MNTHGRLIIALIPAASLLLSACAMDDASATRKGPDVRNAPQRTVSATQAPRKADMSAVHDPQSPLRPCVSLPLGVGTSSRGLAFDVSEPELFGLLHVTHANDMETGRVAQDLATDPQVKAFAGREASEHSIMLRDGDALAERLNITPWLAPPARSLALNHGVAMDGLRSRSGLGFDRAYLDHEIEMHRMVMAGFDTAGGANPEIKRILEEALPALHAHLTAAQDLRDALNAQAPAGAAPARASAKEKARHIAKGMPCGASQQAQRDIGRAN